MPQAAPDRSPTLRDYVRVVWIRKWVVVACVAAFTLAAFAYAFTRPELYEATARLLYSPPTNVANPTSSSTTDLNSLTIQLQSIGNTISSPEVREEAASQMGEQVRGIEYAVRAQVVTPAGASTGSAIADSVDVIAVASTPQAAKSIANAYATAVIQLKKESQQASLQAAQRVVQQQLDLFKTPESRLTTDYATLSQQLRSLQIAEATATGDFRVIQPATAPTSPTAPAPIKVAVLGFGMGLFVGVVLAFILGQFDTAVRSRREVSEILGLPIIGRVPHVSRHKLRAGELVAVSEPEGSVTESFRILRSNLDWSSIDDHLCSLLVTSCTKGEGKTLTVCNLGVTLARAGKKVLIVDADLRNPRVHKVFGVSNSTGLTSVVLGRARLRDALKEYNSPTSVKLPMINTGRNNAGLAAASDVSLYLLTSGPLPPAPGEVAASRSTAALMRELADMDMDYVLIDTPPVLDFGDAGALAPSVDGLLMVTKLEKARRPVLEEGREILESLPCRKVGLVITGERVEDAQYSRYYSESRGSRTPSETSLWRHRGEKREVVSK